MAEERDEAINSLRAEVNTFLTEILSVLNEINAKLNGTESIESTPPSGDLQVKNIYVDNSSGELKVEYNNIPTV